MKKVVILIVVCGLLLCGCSVKKTEELTDAERFANEYSVSDNNPFQYATIDEVLELFENKSGILFLGDSDSEWSAFAAKVLNQVLKEKEVEEVYYFNPESIKQKNSEKYKLLLEKLELEEDYSLPIVYLITDGKVTSSVDSFVHDDFSNSEDNVKELEKEYSNLVSQYV